MVNSKKLTSKSKSTPKISLRSSSVIQNTPTISVQRDDNNDELVNTIRDIIKEELGEHEKKLNEILKSQLQNTNERLDKISNEVLEITKSLEFTQGKLDEEMAIVKNYISKIKSDMQVLEDDLLDPNKVSKKLTDDGCHRFGKRRVSRPRMIVCRFLRFKDKQKVLQNAKKLKDTGIIIYEDFCGDTMELQKSLWEKVLEYHQQGKYAYLNYRTIVVRDKS